MDHGLDVRLGGPVTGGERQEGRRRPGSPDGRRDPGGTVLVVEDTEALRGALVEYFESRGYLVLAAADAGTAFQLARRIPPDLVLTDADLRAEVSGATLAMRLRDTAPEIALVLMTGAQNLLSQAEVDLFDCVLEKPFRLKVASEVVNCLLKRG